MDNIIVEIKQTIIFITKNNNSNSNLIQIKYTHKELIMKIVFPSLDKYQTIQIYCQMTIHSLSVDFSKNIIKK